MAFVPSIENTARAHDEEHMYVRGRGRHTGRWRTLWTRDVHEQRTTNKKRVRVKKVFVTNSVSVRERGVFATNSVFVRERGMFVTNSKNVCNAKMFVTNRKMPLLCVSVCL